MNIPDKVIDAQEPRIAWDLIPTKGLPLRPYTYKGDEPWIPKNTKSPKARRSNKYL